MAKRILFLFVGILVTCTSSRTWCDELAIQPQPQVKIVVNIPARELSLFENDEVIYRFPVAVGSPIYKTPIGERILTQIVWNPWWFPPDSKWAIEEKDTPPGPNNPLGPVKMELGGTIRMHGTKDEKSIGRAVSHGCLRLHNKDAVTLAWWLQSHFSDKNDPSQLENYQEHKKRSFYVDLNRAIPVDIRYNVFEADNNVLKIHPDVYGRLRDLRAELIIFLQNQGFNMNTLKTRKVDSILKEARKNTTEFILSELFEKIDENTAALAISPGE
jgi:murein L,D-transpeptidase YcbB/YkuD